MIERIKKRYKVAVLDKNKVLTGFREIKIDADNHEELNRHLQQYGAYVGRHKIEGDIVIVPDDCDLLPNKYKWTDKGFMPLGFGFPRPKPMQNGITKDHADYLFMKALINGTPIPQECKDWVNWYEENLKKRNEEHLKSKGGNI